MQNTKWFLSIGRQFFKIVPRRTILSVLLSIAGKLFGILASYLPLKIVILLGSSGIPKFFPASFSNIDREVLIIALSVATVTFYLLLLLSEKYLVKLSTQSAIEVIKTTSKLPLFDNQNDIARRGVQRYTEGLAELCFLLIGTLVFAWLSPQILLLLFVYGVFAYTLYRRLSNKQPIDMNDVMDDSGRQRIIMITEVGFFAAFIYIIYEAITLESVNVLMIIITFLLLRRLQASLRKLIFNSVFLLRQRSQLNAILFQQATKPVNKSLNEDFFWSTAQPNKVKQWASLAVERAGYDKVEHIDCQLLELEQKDIFTYRLEGVLQEGKTHHFLLKIYNKKQRMAFHHEVELLKQIPDIPSLNLLVVDKFQGFDYVLFDWPETLTLCDINTWRQTSIKFYQQLTSIDIPDVFLAKYLRTHTILPQRLDKGFWSHFEQMSQALDSSQISEAGELLSYSTVIMERLSTLPLVVVNHKLAKTAMLKTDEDFLVALNWSDWSIEPLGADWPEDQFISNANVEDIVKPEQGDFETSVLNNINLARLLYRFEQLVESQKFHKAFRLIPQILDVCH